MKYFFKHIHLFTAGLLFVGTFLVYFTIFPEPRNWYDHYLHLAKSLLQFRLDVPSLPPYYQDAVSRGNLTFLPFGFVPSVVMIPFYAMNSHITQQQVSIIIGSINVSLAFWLLSRYSNRRSATIVAVFFAFGTVSFWTAVVGTTWYFAHTVAIFFMFLSLISYSYKRDYLSGLFLACAVLSRYPVLLASIFFVLELRNHRSRLFTFLLGFLPVFPIQLAYNFARFGNIFEMGYREVYAVYTSGNYAYSFIRLLAPQLPHFGYMDIRNIPLHIINFLALPPLVSEQFLIKPSPFGMGILFTSPLLLATLIPRFKNKFELHLYLGAFFVALAVFLHYAQGWVQFGYRFLMDFLPFLLILLALRFNFSKLYIALLLFSILVNFWGVLWGIKLGW